MMQDPYGYHYRMQAPYPDRYREMPHGRGMHHERPGWRGDYQRHQQGWGRGCYSRQQCENLPQLTEDKVKQILNGYISGNPNLKVGEIKEKEKTFQAKIVTQDNSLVETLEVDKQTGWIRPVIKEN